MMASKFFANGFRSVLLLGSLLFIVSCGRKSFDSREELMSYITDSENGFTQSKSVNGIDFSVTYRPTDMLVGQELTENKSPHVIDSLRKKYRRQLYFNISLSKKNQEILNTVNSSRSDFGAMVKQLAFGMGNKVKLLTQTKDTVQLLDYIYPRLYGMGGPTNMLFVYSREDVISDDDFFHINIQDLGFSTGEVGFKFPIAPIKDEPCLNF